MRTIVTGVRDGKSCVVEEIDSTLQGGSMEMLSILDLDVAALPSRPPGRGDFLDIQVPEGGLRCCRVSFPPEQEWAMHHTDTIDFHTVAAGSIDLILDDGPHHLTVGDSVIVSGVDHGWRSGPEGCVTSIIVVATPAPQA